MTKITKKMEIMDVVQKYPKAADVFIENGMHCLGCAAAHFENIEEGCLAHGIDADKIVDELNKVVLSSKKTAKKWVFTKRWTLSCTKVYMF